MNMKHLLLCAICLSFSGAPLAQSRSTDEEKAQAQAELDAQMEKMKIYARVSSGEWLYAGVYAVGMRAGMAKSNCSWRRTYATDDKDVEAIKYIGRDGEEVIVECPPKK